MLLLSSSPFSLLFQEVGEVVALVHVVYMFAFLCVQLMDSAAVALLGKQQLTQHPSVRLLVLLLQTVQLGKGTHSHIHTQRNTQTHARTKHMRNGFILVVVKHANSDVVIISCEVFRDATLNY